MTRGRWWALSAVAVLLLGYYVAIGIGYSRLQSACFDSRHSLDGEQPVGGVVVDVLLWPVVLPLAGEQSCLPVPIGSAPPG